MNSVSISIEEIIVTLRNSRLPTLVVEGDSDTDMYRHIEEYLGETGIDILPVGCRFTVIELFKRRSELGDARVAFLADSDLDVFAAVPPELRGIIFTYGYSLENDILFGGKAFGIVGKKYKTRWNGALEAYTDWFSSAIHRHYLGEEPALACHPSSVVDLKNGVLLANAAASVIEKRELCKQGKMVVGDPIRYLRGHSLLDALACFLACNKHPRKCSKGVLLYMDIQSAQQNERLQRLFAEVKNALCAKSV